MDEKMRQRLVGAVVLVALVVIFVPMLLDDEPMVTSSITQSNIPLKPKADLPVRIISRKEVKPLVSTAPVAESAKAAHSKPKAKPAAVAPKARAGISAWVVQVASFEKRENANKLVKRLKATKLSAFLEQASVSKKTVFRVRVGPEVDHKKAEAIRARIERKFKLKGKIERYP